MNGINQYDYLTVGDEYDFSTHSLLLTATGQHECHMVIRAKGFADKCILERQQQGFFVMRPATLKIEKGGLHYLPLDFKKLAKLQVFIDKGKFKKRGDSEEFCWGYLPSSLGLQPTTKDIEYWLLHQSLQARYGIERFSSVLRNNEWYTLVDFLFNEMHEDNNQRLQVLCSRYGLSVSHFRRLASNALGNSTKAELRDWRLVKALLELVDSQNNLTTIAMNHGYASLSHFSNEVKDALGVSPRNLKKLLHVS